MDDFAELIALNDNRAAAYGLLSRLYRVEVDAAFLGTLRQMRFPARTGNDAADAGYRAIATYLSNAQADALTELAVDYFRTFYGEGVDSYSAAHPFESVYTSPKRLLMQEARDEVLAIYRSMNLDKQESWKEGEDHLALELEFLQVMAQRAAGALRDGDEDAAVAFLVNSRNFLDDHVLSWTPMLTEDMRRFARTGLYRGLADLTDGYLEVDRQFLDDVLDADE